MGGLVRPWAWLLCSTKQKAGLVGGKKEKKKKKAASIFCSDPANCFRTGALLERIAERLRVAALGKTHI